jgi:hypothetical protein
METRYYETVASAPLPVAASSTASSTEPHIAAETATIKVCSVAPATPSSSTLFAIHESAAMRWIELDYEIQKTELATATVLCFHLSCPVLHCTDYCCTTVFV